MCVKDEKLGSMHETLLSNFRSARLVSSAKERRAWCLYNAALGAFLYGVVNFIQLLLLAQGKENAHMAVCSHLLGAEAPALSEAGEPMHTWDCEIYNATAPEWCDCLQRKTTWFDFTDEEGHEIPEGREIPERTLVPFMWLFNVNYATVYSMATSVSVVFQLFFFLCCSSMADYGNMRYHLLLGSTLVGAVACCLVALIGSSYTVFAMNFNVFMFIIANVAFGFAFIVYNSYLPLLIEAHPDVVDKQHNVEEHEKIREAEQSQLSGNGVKVGMLGQMVFLLLSAVAGMSLPNMIAFGGVWSGGIGILAVRQLLAHPGRPLPPNAGYVGTSIRQLSSTIGQLKSLSQLSLFLFAYFIFSGGCSTFASQATTLASKTVDASDATIICLVIVISITAIVGCILAFNCNATPKMLLIGSLCLQSMLPLYALKLDQTWQLFMIGILFGLSTGPQQAFTRSIFSSTLPKGHQTEFFWLLCDHR